MKKIKILSIFGTRPEAIKMAPLIHKFIAHPEIDSKVCITAQHRSMLDQVLTVFNIKPDYDLDIMKQGQELSEVSRSILQGVEKILHKEKPDLVVVHGDTTTTFMASLAAFYQKIKIAHIEAGLRTGDLYSPWPEEANRKLTSIITRLHFSPTKEAKQNLLNEGISPEIIFQTGNTIVDSLYSVINKISNNDILRSELEEFFNFLPAGKRIILVTGHRRENFGGGLEQICEALKLIANQFLDVSIVYPVHPNPKVQEPVNRALKNIDNIYLIEPLNYIPFVYLMQKSYLVLTDSGGIQEEAPSLGKPVLVMRNTTERPEALNAGTVRLVGVQKDKIYNETRELLTNRTIYERMSKAHNPYGDGNASQYIVDKIIELKHEL